MRRRFTSLLAIGSAATVLLAPRAALAQGTLGGSAPPVVTLREAIDRAIAVSPITVGASVATDNAEVAARESLGAFLPSFNAGSNFATSSNERFDQATGQLVSRNYSAQASGSLELFSFGRRFADRSAASAQVDAANANETDQRFQIALLTTQTYYDVAASSEQLRVAGQRLERAQAQLDFARTRLELETAPRSDVLRAELEVGNAELAILDAQVVRTTSALELGRLIGVSGEVLAEVETLPRQAPPLPMLEHLVPLAEAAAPPVEAARAQLSSSSAQKFSAYTRYAPSLRMTGGYDWFAFNFPPSQRSWNVRVSLSLPLFDGFTREANVARARAQERLARARLDDAVRVARVRVEDAYRRILAAERRAEIARRGVDLAQEDLRVQEERYTLGLSTIIDLQTSQLALADAEQTEVAERRNLGVAIAQLETVLGRSLDDVQR